MPILIKAFNVNRRPSIRTRDWIIFHSFFTLGLFRYKKKNWFPYENKKQFLTFGFTMMLEKQTMIIVITKLNFVKIVTGMQLMSQIDIGALYLLITIPGLEEGRK